MSGMSPEDYVQLQASVEQLETMMLETIGRSAVRVEKGIVARGGSERLARDLAYVWGDMLTQKWIGARMPDGGRDEEDDA